MRAGPRPGPEPGQQHRGGTRRPRRFGEAAGSDGRDEVSCLPLSLRLLEPQEESFTAGLGLRACAPCEPAGPGGQPCVVVNPRAFDWEESPQLPPTRPNFLPCLLPQNKYPLPASQMPWRGSAAVAAGWRQPSPAEAGPDGPAGLLFLDFSGIQFSEREKPEAPSTHSHFPWESACFWH